MIFPAPPPPVHPAAKIVAALLTASLRRVHALGWSAADFHAAVQTEQRLWPKLKLTRLLERALRRLQRQMN